MKAAQPTSKKEKYTSYNVTCLITTRSFRYVDKTLFRNLEIDRGWVISTDAVTGIAFGHRDGNGRKIQERLFLPKRKLWMNERERKGER